jgi:hypothetical protein
VFDTNDVKTQTHRTVRNVFSWSVLGKVTIYGFARFLFLFGGKGKIGEVEELFFLHTS